MIARMNRPERRLPLGWRTDLAVLRLGGAEITEHADHLVVRSPHNPTYYWGNFVLVTDPAVVDDPERWLAEFERLFPAADHRAIGLVSEPADPQSWLSIRLFIEYADVLSATGPISTGPLADGYDARPLTTSSDWAGSTRLRQATFPGQDEYEQLTTETRIAVSATGELTWFGAFVGDELVAELGIADCGDRVGRYQSVLTHPEHRRRGLTRHLLGVAASHARERGAAETLVIIADADTDAGRLYRTAGFEFAEKAYQVSRVPQPDE
jgi:GNAT superfamily N-acetyltransferase